MVMTSSSSAAVCGLSVLFASVAGCGLISSDIASIGFDLPERSYTFDTEKKGVNLPAASLPSLACTDAAGCCAAATLAGIDCALVTCATEAPSPTCAIVATIETPPQKVDLKSEAPQLSGYSKQSVLDVTISKITYLVTPDANRPLNVDLPAVELFVAPEGTLSTSDPRAKKFGTVPPTPAAKQTTTGTVALDAAGQQAFVDFAHNFGTPFVFLGRTTLLIPGGTPVPMGAITLTIQGRLLAKPSL